MKQLQAVNDLEQVVKEFEVNHRKSLLESGMRPFKPKSTEDRMKKYDEDTRLAEMARQNRVPLFSPDTDIFVQPGFVLFGGISGKGKSNVGANLVAGYLNNGGSKPVIIITNEETSESVYNRIACIMMGFNFYALRNGTMPEKQRSAVRSSVKLLSQQVEVVFEGDWDTNTYEDVVSVIDYGVSSQVGLIVGDYWQNINQSKVEAAQESFKVSKRLGGTMKEYGKRATMPVVFLVQLNSSTEQDFKERIENDKTLYNHAFQAIELVPDFETRTTTFKVHKDRYGGSQGAEIVVKYENGIYRYEGGL